MMCSVYETNETVEGRHTQPREQRAESVGYAATPHAQARDRLDRSQVSKVQWAQGSASHAEPWLKARRE